VRQRPQTIADWLIDHQGEYQTRDELRKAAVSDIGTTSKQVSAVMCQLEREGDLSPAGYYYGAMAVQISPAAPDAPVPDGSTPSIGLDEFRAQFDLRISIRQGIAKLTPGRIYPDQAFRGFCGISSTGDWRRFADMAEFAPHRLRVRGILHWAHADTIREMRTIIGG
jgi:hypothetical protein